MIKIPDWLAKLPKDAKLNTDEFAKALNLSKSSIAQKLSKGSLDFPKCDVYMRRSATSSTSISGAPKNKKPLWKAVTVRNYIRHLNRLELEKANDARTTKKPA